MKIIEITVYVIHIPFKEAFKHALASRRLAENVVVQVKTDSGLLGFGESVPREYVTGETIESVLFQLSNHLVPLVWPCEWKSKEDFFNFIQNFGAEIEKEIGCSEEKVPAARCALECALLDAAGKVFQCKAAELLGWKLENRPTYYSGVISSDRVRKATFKAFLMRLYGFGMVKLKVGDENDLIKTKKIRQVLGPKIDLRVDANGAWETEEALEQLTRLAPFNISAVEQPVAKENLRGMKEITKRSEIDVVADESFCGIPSAEELLEEKGCDILNIRISKCGGLYNSGKIAKLAQEFGMGIQLGCQVGETALLSSAGRQFAQAHPNLRYIEGSYERFLLQEDISKNRVCFFRKGKGEPLKGMGFGVEVDLEAVNRLAQTYSVLKPR